MTLCVSTVFAVVRCPSACPSVCPVRYSIQTAEDSVKLLSRPGSPIILVLVFLTPGADTQFRGAKYTGWGQICDYRLAVYLGNGTR